MLFSNDILNQLANIDENTLIYQLRQKRPVVVNATQASLIALFSSSIESITIVERAYVAIYTAQLTKQPLLVDYFLSDFQTLSVSTLAQIKHNQIDKISTPRLKQILLFTQSVTLSPVNSSEHDLVQLQQAGLTTEAIVVLTQLISFISYQARVLSGLIALNQYVNIDTGAYDKTDKR